MTTATQSAAVLLRAFAFLKKGDVLSAKFVLTQEICDCSELGCDPDTTVMSALNWIDLGHVEVAREVIERAIL